jgi:hypothetical protein
VRIGREEWMGLHPEDVAWVTEWQLASAFSWVPIGADSPVSPRPYPDRAGGCWTVEIRAGEDVAQVRLPVRDLARLVRWCHMAPAYEALFMPPATVRASIHALRNALRAGLRGLDPLERMGYAVGATRDPDPGQRGERFGNL